ncbi:hypothetical protein BTN33_22825 [Aeromonas veronii]|uniref:ATP-binding protein n=1 Tax=Aeromonas veronii TaxID=654 RepID=UPI0009472D3A|nr:hypothetical protein BTN33_22825 [Aeromonas veronii]
MQIAGINACILTLAKQVLWLLDLSARQAACLLEVIEGRYQQGNSAIGSQLPVSEWHQMVSHPTIANRLLHHSLKG